MADVPKYYTYSSDMNHANERIFLNKKKISSLIINLRMFQTLPCLVPSQRFQFVVMKKKKRRQPHLSRSVATISNALVLR